MKVLIAGLPKSGTTGLLYLIFNSLGQRPKLIFEPDTCPSGLDGARHVLAKVLIKPQLHQETFQGFERKITIVRDPRDRLISALLYSQYHSKHLDNEEYMAAVLSCLQQKEQDPARVSINKVLSTFQQKPAKDNLLQKQKKQIEKHLSLLDNYLTAMSDSLVYKYEDFVSENYQPLQEFLGQKLKGKPQVPNRLERVCRTKDSGNWRDWLTEEDVRILKPAMDPWLERFGYDSKDWALNQNPRIDPEHCSRYFQRLVQESREKHRAAPHQGQKPGSQPEVPSYIRKWRKLKRDPYDFFADSQNPFLRRLRIFFKNQETE